MRDIAPQDWISREQAAQILGTTYDTVKRLEKRGMLHGKKSKEGAMRLDPREVNELALTYVPQLGRPKKPIDQIKTRPLTPGSIDAMVTELIEAGKKPAEIVRQLRVSYARVHEVWRAWRADWGALEVVTPEVLAQQSLEVARDRAAARIVVAQSEAEKALYKSGALGSGANTSPVAARASSK